MSQANTDLVEKFLLAAHLCSFAGWSTSWFHKDIRYELSTGDAAGIANTKNLTDAIRRRNRGMLVALFLLFFGGMLVAGLLRFSGWRPQGSKNKGELLQPYGDLRGYAPSLADGRAYRWKDAPRTWRIVAMPRDCDGARAAECARLLADLDKHAEPLERCMPAIKDAPPGRYVAFLSISVNIGTAGVCRSSIARDFNAGRIREACNDLLKFNRAAGFVMPGLTRRRQKERELCLQGL